MEISKRRLEVRTVYLGKVLMSALFTVMLLTSVTLPLLILTASTAAGEGEATIWTEDVQGNVRTDFEPDENVHICGSGFNLSSLIDITITKPDNTVFQDSTSSDDNGSFVYVYQLDGMIGTYYVTATDGENSASTTFTDGLAWVKSWGPPIYPQEKDNFLDNENVYAMIKTTGGGSKTVRIYVVENEAWKNGVPLVDVSGDNYNVVTLVDAGEHGPFLIWQAPTMPGGYDIVVDEDNDGIRDPGEKVDYSDPPPGLIIAPSAVPVRDVEVSILPEYQDGQPGATLTYIVTAKNVGNVADNYVLIAWDNVGWLGPWTQELIDVSPGENRTKPLSVTIPENAVPCTKDNIIVRATSQADNRVSAENSAVAHAVAFLRKVKVSLTPTHQGNVPGATLNYAVVVANEGDVADNYALTASDNENWRPTVMPSSLAIAPGASDNATLSVVIPEKTWAYKETTVVVTATSTENSEVSASDAGVAETSVIRGVDVSISPRENEALPGENVTFAVTITNTGNVEDSYDITVSDNSGWPIEFGLTWVKLAPYGSAIVWSLKVTVPENAVPGSPDNITVTAVSENDPMVMDNDSCIARAKVVRGVGVSILENYQENENGGMLTYTVVIVNTGNVPDSYALENIDTLGWSLSLSKSLLENIGNGASEGVTLTVAIPENARGRTLDNITVTATSQENENVWDDESCLAHVRVVAGVDVRIEPGRQGHFPGENLTYTVTVINAGNVQDNYDLSVSDTENWGPTLSKYRIENLNPTESENATLTVTVPENMTYLENDNITVTATSQENGSLSDSAVCTAHTLLPRAEFKLENLYKVCLDMNLWLENGSKLVVKFYKYDNITFQAESVIENFAPPKHVENIENVPHPSGLVPVERVRLVLTTDDTEEVIYTIASFTVTKVVLADRYLDIKLEYVKPGADRPALAAEYLQIKTQYIKAP